MTTTIENTMTVERAEKLWADLHDSLLEFENNLIMIITAGPQAWEPLGYASFTEAWKARMSHIRISEYLKPHVIYKMYEEGRTVEEVADIVNGVGLPTAEILKEQFLDDVPADVTTTIVHEHRRGAPTKRWVSWEIPDDVYREWNRKAKAAGTTIAAVSERATTAAFAAM